MHAEVKVYVQTCKQCQLQDSTRNKKLMYLTHSVFLFSKLVVDAVHMSNCQGYWYLIIEQYDTLRWIEAQPNKKLTAERVANFFWKDFIC